MSLTTIPRELSWLKVHIPDYLKIIEYLDDKFPGWLTTSSSSLISKSANTKDVPCKKRISYDELTNHLGAEKLVQMLGNVGIKTKMDVLRDYMPGGLSSVDVDGLAADTLAAGVSVKAETDVLKKLTNDFQSSYEAAPTVGTNLTNKTIGMLRQLHKAPGDR